MRFASDLFIASLGSRNSEIAKRRRERILLESQNSQRRISLMIEKTSNGNEQLLTAEEIAAILKISLNTVHNHEWQKRNRCPLIKIGKRRYAMESTFWKWVEGRGLTRDGKTD